MKWKNFWRDVVSKYRVVVDGWPENIQFGNLSDVVTSLADLETLLRKWRSGAIHFRSIGDDEFKQMLDKRDEQIENGEIDEPPCKARSDKGRKHQRSNSSADAVPRKRKVKITSSETVDSDGDGSDSSSSDKGSGAENVDDGDSE